ncbi:hypothetical protein SUGI_0725310 [Cryptomeria japonica]|uniref:uncharacterized protein LOC131045208 n=1 Tax=Cryptomeria japonica TaxID=3369 RepID=UPI002414B700|nr:uncharacterized protein LOC131045208 [Cryptomeria japonica]GLJ36152.1 hypothetical protein SUGI_0725310 [Cryptomeria japonica]
MSYHQIDDEQKEKNIADEKLLRPNFFSMNVGFLSPKFWRLVGGMKICTKLYPSAQPSRQPSSLETQVSPKTSEEALKLEIEYVRNLGILEGSKAFANALAAVDSSGLENFENKLKLLTTLGLLENEILKIVRWFPSTLSGGIDKIKKNMDFLKNTAGFQPNIVVTHSRLLTYSVENRLLPRHKVFEFLRETDPSRLPKSLVKVYNLSERSFADKFLLGTPEAAKLFENYKGKSVDLAIS